MVHELVLKRKYLLVLFAFTPSLTLTYKSIGFENFDKKGLVYSVTALKYFKSYLA